MRKLLLPLLLLFLTALPTLAETVSFYGFDGVLLSTAEIEPGARVPEPAEPDAGAGYRFVGFATDTGRGWSFQKDVMPDAPLSLYAARRKAPDCKKITLNYESLTLRIGESAQLTAKLSPASCRDQVTFHSSRADIVSVSAEGWLTARALGSAMISVFAGEQSAKLTVTVVRMVETIEVSYPAVVAAGASVKGTVTVLPIDAASRKVVYSVSDSSIASVNTNGELRAKKNTGGNMVTLRVTATDGSGVFAEAEIAIFPVIRSIAFAIDGKPQTSLLYDLAQGAQLSVVPVITPDSAYSGLSWASSDVSIADVADGLVTFFAPGKVTISARAEDGSGFSSKLVLTAKNLVHSIELMGPETLFSGQKGSYAVTVLPEEASQSVTFTSSNTDVLTINKSGVATAKQVKSAKTVTLTATANDGSGVTATITVRVLPAK